MQDPHYPPQLETTMDHLDTITAATLGTLLLGLTLWVLVTLAQWAASGMDVTAGVLR